MTSTPALIAPAPEGVLPAHRPTQRSGLGLGRRRPAAAHSLASRMSESRDGDGVTVEVGAGELGNVVEHQGVDVHVEDPVDLG